jgi:hypothetical protein
LVHVAHLEAVRRRGAVEVVERYRYVAEIKADIQNVDAERGSSSGEDSAVAMETKGRSFRHLTITSVRSQSGDTLIKEKKPHIKPTSEDPRATLVLGLLEMKGEGFFRRAPDKIKLHGCAVRTA